MCFVVDKSEAKHWHGKKIGWKVVQLIDDDIISDGWIHLWQTGVNQAIGTFVDEHNASSRGGIYVFGNKRVAKQNTGGRRVLLKVFLDDNDFIAAGKIAGLRVATYRKVTVPENQPEIEWY